jgi:hypothetical protein
MGDGAIVELTVENNSVAGYSPERYDVSAGSLRISTIRSRCYGTTVQARILKKI